MSCISINFDNVEINENICRDNGLCFHLFPSESSLTKEEKNRNIHYILNSSPIIRINSHIPSREWEEILDLDDSIVLNIDQLCFRQELDDVEDSVEFGKILHKFASRHMPNLRVWCIHIKNGERWETESSEIYETFYKMLKNTTRIEKAKS